LPVGIAGFSGEKEKFPPFVGEGREFSSTPEAKRGLFSDPQVASGRFIFFTAFKKFFVRNCINYFGIFDLGSDYRYGIPIHIFVDKV
jgi:hypothetical protein